MSQQDLMTEVLLRRLSDASDDIRRQWDNPIGTNTRHFVVDNLFEESIASEIYEAFPKDGNGFFSRESFREKKRTSANLNDYNSILGDVTYAFQDQRVVNLISQLLRLKDIEPDPKLYAGGLSMMFNGDFLNPHLDNSHDSDRRRYRRLNLLYYVSPSWKVENGGNFELWDEGRKNPKTIVSATNRLVVMETNKFSWHSVSAVKVDSPRCCVSNYYFSKVSPDGEEYFHVTSFTGRPEERIKQVYGVLDNAARNIVSKVLKVGRGKSLINKHK